MTRRGSARIGGYATLAAVALVAALALRRPELAIVGAPFAVLAEVPWGDFAWTRGTPVTFRSSSRSARDFCAQCGTPLSYREVGGPIVELMTGTFDDPTRVVPTYEVGTESQLAWVDRIGEMPGKTTLENTGAQKLATIVSYQHPDHDT